MKSRPYVRRAHLTTEQRRRADRRLIVARLVGVGNTGDPEGRGRAYDAEGAFRDRESRWLTLRRLLVAKARGDERRGGADRLVALSSFCRAQVSPDVWVERCAALQALHQRFFANWIEKVRPTSSVSPGQDGRIGEETSSRVRLWGLQAAWIVAVLLVPSTPRSP